MTYQILAEFHQQYDIEHIQNIVLTVDPSYARCNPIVRQLAEFKQSLSWYKQYQVIKSFSQKTINRVNRFLNCLKQARISKENLTDNSKTDLRKHIKLIVKSFRYMGDLITPSKKLAYYIIKLAALTGFLIKRHYEATFQLHQAV